MTERKHKHFEQTAFLLENKSFLNRAIYRSPAINAKYFVYHQRLLTEIKNNQYSDNQIIMGGINLDLNNEPETVKNYLNNLNGHNM